jgi:subtilisin family serine protease
MISAIDLGGRSPGAVDRPVPITLLNPRELGWARPLPGLGPVTHPGDYAQPQVDGPGSDGPVHVGLIDTGVTVHLDGRPHEYLADALDPDWRDGDNIDDVPQRGLPPGDTDNHGTFCAGLVRAAAPDAVLHMRKALDLADATKVDGLVARHLRELAGIPGLHVINLSFFGADDEERPEGIHAALAEIFAGGRSDLIVVTAAGNRWNPHPLYPGRFAAEFPFVVSVGAIDESITLSADQGPPRAAFSNCWPGITLYAPGARVRGPVIAYEDGKSQDKYSEWSGTSFAAASVSGLLAKAIAGGHTAGEALRALLAGPRFAPIPGDPATRPYIAREAWHTA